MKSLPLRAWASRLSWSVCSSLPAYVRLLIIKRTGWTGNSQVLITCQLVKRIVLYVSLGLSEPVCIEGSDYCNLKTILNEIQVC